MFKANNKVTMNIFHSFFSGSVGDFEQVNVSWDSPLQMYLNLL